MTWPINFDLTGKTWPESTFAGTNYYRNWSLFWDDFEAEVAAILSASGLPLNGTSTTSYSLSTGSKIFTVEANKGWAVGSPVRIAMTTDPSNIWAQGIVTAYSGTTLTVDVQHRRGTGTYTNWTISVGGDGSYEPGGFSRVPHVNGSNTGLIDDPGLTFNNGQLVIDQDNATVGALDITSASNTASDVFAVTITADNAGAGKPGGIDLSSFAINEPIFSVPTDTATSVGSQSHQIAVRVGGVTRFIALYQEP